MAHLRRRAGPVPPWQKLLAAESRSDLATEVVTIPEALEPRGYAAGFFGMWNLGRGRSGPCTPGGQGFDTVVFPENLGLGKDAYFDDQGNYVSDRLADAVLEFVERNRERPLFVYLADHAVHAPLKGSKGELYEGGIRVPLENIDLYPPLLDLAGAPPPAAT